MSETREILRHYLNIGTKLMPKYVLLGDGITGLTEEFNPEQETKHYINQGQGTTNVKSYTPSISVSQEYIVDTELQKWLSEQVRKLPTGSSAETDYIRINLKEPVSSGDGEYIAINQPCSYQIDSNGGDAGEALVTGFTLGAKGDSTEGVFDIKDSTFTAGAE